MNLGSVQAADQVKLTFPIEEQIIRRRVYGAPSPTVIGGYEYERLIFRGNTVVSIDPSGRNYPLYQRQRYRGQPCWIKVERFVSDESISW